MINYLLSFFSLILFSIGYFSQKTYLAKVDGSAQKYRGRPLFRPYFGKTPKLDIKIFETEKKNHFGF